MVKKTRQQPGLKKGLGGHWSSMAKKTGPSRWLLFSLERSQAFIIFNRMRKQWSASKWSNRSSVCVCVCARECLRCGQPQDVAQVVALVGELEGSQAAAAAAAPEEANKQQKEAEAVSAPIKSIIISVNCCTTPGGA